MNRNIGNNIFAIPMFMIFYETRNIICIDLKSGDSVEITKDRLICAQIVE